MLGLGTSIVTSGAVLESALFDDFGGAAVGYSVRRLNSDYDGPCMRVRRDSDNAERDIYFGVDDILDTATLEDFCDGTDGYVVRWYNQTEEYGSTKLLDQSYASSPEAAYSVRQLDGSYDGPCIEVASSEDVIGFRMTEDQVGSGNLSLRYTDTSAYSGGATVFTGEVYVDAPSHITANKNVRFRLQMTKSGGGAAFSNYVAVSPANQKKWVKATWTLDAVPIENFFQLNHDRAVGTDFLKGDQVLFRNIEATGYTAVYDEDDYSIVNFADEAEVTKGYNIPFTTDGDLDEAKIVEHGYASPFECFEIRVNNVGDGTTNTSGNYYIEIPSAGMSENADTAGDYTVTLELYADCPSVSGDVKIKGQIGADIRSFAEGNTLPQKQWVTRTMTLPSVISTNVVGRFYFAGDSQVVQQLEFGDVIYFRRVNLNHENDTDFNAEFEFSSSDNGFVKGGVGLSEYDVAVGKAPAEELAVTTWYDQSGNENDATQTTLANMPRAYQYDSTTKGYRVSKDNGSAAISWSAASGQLLNTSYTTNSSEFTVVAVANGDDSLTNKTIVLTPEALVFLGSDERAKHIQGNAAQTSYSNADFNDQAIHFVGNSGSESFAGENGDTLTTLSESAATNSLLRIGNNGNGGIPFLGTIQEIVYYTSDKSSDRSDIEDNIDAHFRVTNNLDASQSDNTKQPKVVDSGSVNTVEGEPSLLFSAAEGLQIAESFSGDTVFGFSVASPSDISGNRHVWSNLDSFNDGIEFRVIGSDNKIELSLNDTDTSFIKPFENQNLLVYGYNGSNATLAINGSSTTAVVDETISVSSDSSVGARFSPSFGAQFSGDIQEFVLYTSDQSSNRVGVEDNINDFYSIYNKADFSLLDYYPGAAAAYSLRLLDTTYTGSAIRVRRASDNAEQDIGFDSNNELDTTALATFCSGTNGFVKTWYDQSGNSNDATETSTGNQPKIYDASTGVIVDANGKPALKGDFSSYAKLTLSSDIIGAGDYSVFAYHSYSDRDMLYGGPLPTFGAWQNAGGYFQRFDDGSNAVVSGSYVTGDLMLHYSNRLNGDWSLGINGDTPSTGSNSANFTIDKLFAGFGNQYHFDGYFGEIIFYESDQSSNRSGIETNINDFYSIF